MPSTMDQDRFDRMQPPWTLDAQIPLETGVTWQVLSSVPSKYKEDTGDESQRKPVLLFLHGSLHSAWIWKEKYFQYFTVRGYPCMAISFEGTSHSTVDDPKKAKRKIKIMDRVRHFKCFLENHLRDVIGDRAPQSLKVIKPVIVAHSMASMTIFKYLEAERYEKEAAYVGNMLSGIVFMAPVPPGGMRKMKRTHSMRETIFILRALVMKKCLKNISQCRTLFYGGDTKTQEDGTTIEYDYGVSNDTIKEYQERMAQDGKLSLDISDLNSKLPEVSEDGKAPFAIKPKCLVIGASRDFLVDQAALEDTANYLVCMDAPVIVDSPHNVMLGENYKEAAKALAAWLEKL